MEHKKIIPIRDDFREVIIIDDEKRKCFVRKQYMGSDGWTYYSGGEGYFNREMTFEQVERVLKLIEDNCVKLKEMDE